MTVVSGNIRFMRIFAGVRLGRGVKRHWGLSTTAIYGNLGGYVFEDFKDTANNIIWRHSTPCWPVTVCKMNDLEWPWVAISCQNPFFCQHFLNHSVWMSKVIQLMRFCGVLCIARSVSQPRKTCTADALFLCSSWLSWASCIQCQTRT